MKLSIFQWRNSISEHVLLLPGLCPPIRVPMDTGSSENSPRLGDAERCSRCDPQSLKGAVRPQNSGGDSLPLVSHTSQDQLGTDINRFLVYSVI